jgi:catechol 2,3-dioxygenase-like lactoylglutathione lyase family enzyme
MEPHPTQVIGIAVIGIYVSDLERAKNFYVNHLGLEDKGEMGAGHMLALDEVSFYLEPGRNKNVLNRTRKDADITICFSVKSVKSAYDEIEKRDIQIVAEYAEYSPEYALFMIADPDGNIIEIAGNP